MPIITEEETDDILYCARANEIEELKNYIPTLFPKYGTQPAWIISQAVDAETGNTALHYASANGHLDMATYLLSLFSTPTSPSTSPASDPKPFINRQNTSGNTALHWSSLNGHLSIAKLLIASGADASILNFSGHDAVYEAELNDKQEVAEWLLKEALGLEKGIGREGEGDAEGEEGEDVDGVEDVDVGEETVRVADGMKEMDLQGGRRESHGGKDYWETYRKNFYDTFGFQDGKHGFDYEV